MLLSVVAQEGGGGALGSIIGFIIAVVAIVSAWIIFTKADKPGWASIIPIYNIWVVLEITGKPGWWILLYFIPFVNIIIALLVAHGISTVFGKGAGFTIGLILIPPLFLALLAFGDAEYQGAPAATA